ncbi:hypothetical protein R3P38DRAFT_2848609 [Favolaschia claudopus]|uniref:Uncharacterized protein n=1 Tax=Favolaschia claudopus TaxID=2862362 RepID=A0AAW0DVI5_9AGAR
MVLQKRKRDGEFETWHPSGSSSSPTHPMASTSQPQPSPVADIDHLPPTKKPRQDSSSLVISSHTPIQASSSQKPTAIKAPPTKKSKGKAAEPAEKRAAVFKRKCPQNIWDRYERVMSQRFFMVDRQRFEGELKEEFKVLGSTGNIYTVTIQQVPRCDCPDAEKGNHCKHILFVYLKVLQVPSTSGHWYQKALLTEELESIFANAPRAPNHVASARTREAYARATGKAAAPSTPEPSEASGPKKRIPGEEDDCPICYENMHGAAEPLLTFCEQCGNAVHKECFGQWKSTSAKQGKPLTCIYCRAAWPKASAGGAVAGSSGARLSEDGYLNLSGAAGVSPQRDTSSYYDGPRRGYRSYGYRGYYGRY